MDVQFLKINCQAFCVYPKFIFFELPSVSKSDEVHIRKRLLRTSILRRTREKRKMDTELEMQWSKIGKASSSIDKFILKKVTQHSVDCKLSEFVKGHVKKFKGLTKTSYVPFTHKDTVLDVSSYKLSEEELGTLKFGLTFSIKPNVTFSQNLNSIAKVLKDISQTRAKAIKCNQQRLATSLTTTQPRSQGPLSTSRSRERTLGTRLYLPPYNSPAVPYLEPGE